MTRQLFFLGLMLVSSMTSAEVYKWVDAQGQVHYQDHPRGSTEKFSTDESSSKQTSQASHKKRKTKKLLNAMEKSRKQREQDLHKRLAAQRKQDEKCIKLRDQAGKLEARIKKQYSEFSNDRPPSYDRQQKQLVQRQKYLEKYCN